MIKKSFGRFEKLDFAPPSLRFDFSVFKVKAVYLVASLFLAILLLPIETHARFVQALDVKALMERSQLVFVGRVKSIAPSGITTELSYPTWKGVVFEWLKVEVEVVEPIKGTKKGEVVQTLMLSNRGHAPMINQPGMVDPKIGENHLLCLLPTNLKGMYASVTAPFDDDQAVFPLDHKHWTSGTYYKDGKEIPFRAQSEKNRVLWDLVNDRGEINREEAEHLRTIYKAEIATRPPRKAIIYLKWKEETSTGGWQWNVPDNRIDPGAEK